MFSIHLSFSNEPQPHICIYFTIYQGYVKSFDTIQLSVKEYNLAIFSYIEYLKQKRFYSIITALFVTFYSMHKYFQEIYGIKNLNGMTSHEYKNKLAKIISTASLASQPCHNKRHSQKFAFWCPNIQNLTLSLNQQIYPLDQINTDYLQY